jgi:hypothetical protein
MCFPRRCEPGCADCKKARTRTIGGEQKRLAAPTHWYFDTLEDARYARDRFLGTIAGNRSPLGHMTTNEDFDFAHLVPHKNAKALLDCQCTVFE